MTINVGQANDGSIPVAGPAGDLPEFAAAVVDRLGLNPGGQGRGVRAGVDGPGSKAAVALSTASAVPSGPAFATTRVLPRGLVNQAAADPWKIA